MSSTYKLNVSIQLICKVFNDTINKFSSIILLQNTWNANPFLSRHSAKHHVLNRVGKIISRPMIYAVQNPVICLIRQVFLCHNQSLNVTVHNSMQ